MSQTVEIRPRPEGVALDQEEERRYRERTPRSLELLERTKPLIPTGHGGGMWYQLPYPVLLERGKGCAGLGRRRQRVPRPPDRRLGDDPRPRERSVMRDAIVAQLEKGDRSSAAADWDLSYRMASLLHRADAVASSASASSSPAPRRTCSPCGSRGRTPAAVKLAKAAGQLPRPRRSHGRRQLDRRHRADRVPAGVSPRRRRGARRDPVQRPRRRRGDPRARARPSIAAVLVEPVQGAAGMIAGDDGVPPAAARRDRAARHRADLRRGRHVPDRLRRRAGVLTASRPT